MSEPIGVNEPEPCKIHWMPWCAVCNGDAKKFEETQKPDWDEILFEGLHGRNK